MFQHPISNPRWDQGSGSSCWCVAVTSGVSFLEGLLLNLQVVVMAGLSVVPGPQLIDGEVTP